MTDIVTGTPAVVGFTHGDHGNHGWSDKDMQYAASVDRGEQVRDIIRDVGSSAAGVLAAAVANGVAIEKNGRSTELAVEKTAAANILENAKNAAAINLNVEKIHTANQLEAAKNFAAVSLQATTFHADLASKMAECCCELKALVIAGDAARIRDELNTFRIAAAVSAK